MEPKGGALAVFLGTYTPKLDDKGRLIMPARFRGELAAGLVITGTQEHALAVYPQATFEELFSALLAAPSTLQEVRDYQRMVSSLASEETLDKQGRLSIAPQLRKYANLKRDAVVIGAMNRVEIWDAEDWREYSEKAEANFATLDQELLASLRT